MSQNVTNWTWNDAKLLAADLTCRGNVTDEDIAAQCKVTRRTVARWKTNPQFQEKVCEFVKETEERLLTEGVASRVERVKRLNRDWERMQRVLDARAESMVDVDEGGETGLLVRQRKGLGSGDNFEIVEEYTVDTGLLRELRECEKQAAIEVGQWAETVNHTGAAVVVIGGVDVNKALGVAE